MGVSTAQHVIEVSASAFSAPATESQQPLAGRLMSLDAFRGITIAGMILVNNAGDGYAAYWPLKHARWNGWTPTDLVFPFFLFIVGVSMVYSFASRLKRGESRPHLMLHVVKRSAILFAIGVFIVNSFPNRYNLHHIRIEGVLQRIAVCYLICSVLVLWTGRRAQLAAISICLIGFWVLMRFVPVPGFGVPTHDIPLLDRDRNLAAWLDRKLLLGHLYEGTRDPEGVLGTIPALATTLIGVLTGEWLRSGASAKRKAAWMLAMGAVGLAAGKFFDLWFPINKKLWTSSYVLFAGGFALVCLAICYWLLDVREKRGRWTVPIIVFGANAIAAYTFSEALANVLDTYHVQLASGGVLNWQELTYQRVFAPLASPPDASLLYSLAYVLFCWLFAWLLYRKRIFIKV
jgi:predicted acyltransferase